ncbi:septum formation initiator family protein [Patescibacteria group bacterium]|nr:septum formation initiator family protein [Patescibacteria group bacterium]
MFNQKKLFYFIAIIIASVVTVNLGRSVINSYRGNYRLSQLQTQVELATQEIKSLQETLQKEQTNEFVEEQARNKLNLIKPGEKIVISGKNPEKNNGGILGTKQEQQWQTWEKWRYLFLHH